MSFEEKKLIIFFKENLSFCMNNVDILEIFYIDFELLKVTTNDFKQYSINKN